MKPPAIYNFVFSPLKTRSIGMLKDAIEVPLPSSLAETPSPATVLTEPVVVSTARMVLPPIIEAYSFDPSLLSASPVGWLREAVVPAPSSDPAFPSPASVVTVCWDTSILRILLLYKSDT